MRTPIGTAPARLPGAERHAPQPGPPERTPVNAAATSDDILFTATSGPEVPTWNPENRYDQGISIERTALGQSRQRRLASIGSVA